MVSHGIGIARKTVLSLVAIACGCVASEAPPASLGEFADRTLATIDGELDVAGVTAPVEVIRDQWGVPHIYAQNDHDLFFAQGYVMAQDRLWQMEMWRRWHEGRLAEVFGAEAVPYDERTRLMMFRGPFDETEWTSYHPDAHAIFTAYADGVNAFIEENHDNLPVEFQLTGVVPDPWTAETVVLRWAQLALSSTRGHAVNELQLAMNVARFGADEANRRAAPDPFERLVVPEGLDVSLITQEVLDAARAGDGDPFEPGNLPEPEVLEEYRPLMRNVRTALLTSPLTTTEGSNNWVVSGAHTPSGIPILANDPHRRIEMPALRYLVHLVAPGWNVAGGSEPPFVGVNAGNNETTAWGFTFAGTDMVDVVVEEMHPTDDTLVRWQDGWEPLRVITEQITVKGEAAPRTVELRYSRHGPVFYVDTQNRRAYAVQSAVQHPGTAAYLGSFRLMQATSCADFFDRAMHWLVPTHNLICGDRDGNIALQVTGLTPDRDGWNGRLPVPGDGRYEWKGFRTDLPRELNPERGYIATANNNTHPAGYRGRPVFYHSTRGVETSRITRIHQILGGAFRAGEKLSVEDHERVQYDAYSLQAERDIPAFQGWTSDRSDIEWARAQVADWDGILTKESVPGAIYVTWADVVDERARDAGTPIAERRTLAEAALSGTIQELSENYGTDRTQWRYGRIHVSSLPHMFASRFDLDPVERPGGFETVNATGANFRRIIDLSNIDNSVWTNAPGQSAQPGSPFYGNLRENLANGEYFPILFSRGAVEGGQAHRLVLNPAQ
ncbi:MAG: penicillin acylase family protein [Gemmatimonadales bacterium]